MAAATVQGQGRLGKEEQEEEDKEQGARMVPATWLAPHHLDQGGWLLATSTLSSSSLPMVGAQAPLAHVSGAESLLAHQEMLHFWKGSSQFFA